MKFDPNQSSVLLYSLENLIDLLASPTSADVAADPVKAANDRATAVNLRDQIARQLTIEGLKQMPPTAVDGRDVKLAFVRYEGADVTTVGVLRARALPATADVSKALVKAVTRWVNTSDRGHELWQESCCDLNIGDLVADDAFSDPVLRNALREQGLEFIDAVTADCDEALPYDTVLVDESDLLPSRAESVRL